MFRRRTDQVYSTLQQVQRRITEQTGGASATGEESRGEPILPSVQPLSDALPMSRGMPSVQPTIPVLPSSTAMPYSSGGKRFLLQMSIDVAMLLAVAWVASMVVMFVLGRSWGAMPGAGLAAGDAGHRGDTTEASREGVHRQGDYIFVLQSSLRDTPEVERDFQAQAKKCNEYVLRNPRNGWKPYFGLRKPPSGEVQLVFGLVDGQFGVVRDDFLAFAEMLTKQGYTGAQWLRIDGQ